MRDKPGVSAEQAELSRIVRQVRRRWRLKMVLRGAAVALAAGLVTLLAAAYGLEAAKFSPSAIVAFRILAAVVAVSVVGYFLVRPLLQRVSEEQVALYLEEHEPSLDAAIVSAVETSRPDDVASTSQRSPGLVRRLVESAVERCLAIDAGRTLERQPLRRYAAAMAAVLVAAILLFSFGPPYLRHAASALALISRSAEAAAPYRIDVQPGNATVPRGSDQTISARLVGFEADQVELVLRQASGAPFERIPFVPAADAGAYEAMLFDLAGPVEYFAHAAGVRSPVFRLNTVDLPYVQRLDLELRFPAYTGLAPRTIENGGDIAVLRGTEVRLRAFPTIATTGGRLAVNDAEPLGLTPGDGGALEGSFTVDRAGFYRIELDAATGERVAASPQYTIDVLADRPPSVWFEQPRRDIAVTPLEEVFVRARADDDFGVRQLELVYLQNGGPQKTLRLFSGGGKPLTEISAGHMFYLEELGLQPGDFVSYYARATDNDRVQGPKTVTSDLYFMQIRPFGKEFRAATSQAGAGAGASGAQVGALSQQQRQIIAATFNVVRDRKTLTAEKFRESVVFLTLAQARLRQQVEELVTRMSSRLVEPEPSFQKIAELLPEAAREMRAAEAKLQAQDPSAALQPEQRALQHLQKAEEEYQLQVMVGRDAGAGGGAGTSPLAEDLADLFELELDKLASQYETMARAGQQDADRQLDELMEKLRELARRQEQEAERQRRRARADQSARGGGASQRGLAEQAEEAARRLERLAREQDRPDLIEAARRMQEAAAAMRGAAVSGDPSGAGQASAALERLREAQRRLERGQAARAERDVQDALRKADEIARAQGEIAGEVSGLAESGAGQRERVQRLTQRKDALEAEVADLERQLDRTAADIRREERDASRKLQEAANAIRDNKVKEKIRYSRGLIQGEAAGYARNFEQDISKNIEALRQKLGEAAAAVGRSRGDAMTEALERARNLARGLESLGERMRERGQRGGETGSERQSGQPGQQGSGQDARGGGRTSTGRTEGAGGAGDTDGPWSPDGGAWGSRRPGGFIGEDVRQFRGEVRQWSAEGQELRRRLREQGVDVTDMDEILRALRALDADRVYKDAAELERLQTFVVEGLKRFEFGLRRKLAADDEQIVLSGSDEVPQSFRHLVEEYYRRLARRPQR